MSDKRNVGILQPEMKILELIFYELKETNARSLFPREDEIVTLEQNTNQEIEVIVDPMSVPCMQLMSPHV